MMMVNTMMITAYDYTSIYNSIRPLFQRHCTINYDNYGVPRTHHARALFHSGRGIGIMLPSMTGLRIGRARMR
jgi:hypothetical protein